ncbi:MAG: transglutaminase-like domain-containing protein [Chitinophaga rupis]
MTLRRKFLWLTLLFFAVGILNYWCRKKLPYGYGELLSYYQLYSVPDQLRISTFLQTGKDSLLLRFEGANIKERNHFEVYCDGVKTVDQTSSLLTFKPVAALKKYFIKINSADTVSINIEFTPDTGNGRAVATEITTNTILSGINDLRRPEVWTANTPLSAPDSSATTVARYLRDSMKIGKDDPSEEKVLKISRYILSVTRARYGTPVDSMAGLPPIAQLEVVRSGRSKLFCGNFGRIFAFFSDKAGIPARYIESGILTGGILNGPHVVNEVYLKEVHRWAYVDLTDSIVFVKRNDQFLNAVDLFRLLRYGSDDPATIAWSWSKDSLVHLPFGQASFFAKKSFNPSNRLTFYYGNYDRLVSAHNPIEKIRDFLYPAPYYALYSDTISGTNGQFYLRLYSSYLLIALALIWILVLLKIAQVRLRR